ncbi:MAG: DUF3566 domain-containing protein [Microthrixaceae bacterium]
MTKQQASGNKASEPKPKSSPTTRPESADDAPRSTSKATNRGSVAKTTSHGGQATESKRRVLGYRRQRFEARKVRRLVRHVDPWSVLKLSLLLALCMWVVALIASVIIWSVANNTGALDSLERFFQENLRLTDFELTGDVLFRQFGLISLLGALGFAAAMVVASLVFNLVSDIIGGVWISVVEEETARPIVDVAAADQPTRAVDSPRRGSGS